MNTRDLGTHSVELHDHGTLDIIGPDVRLTLPAREIFELMQWLDERREVISQAMLREEDAEERAIERIAEASARPASQEERDMPLDEP